MDATVSDKRYGVDEHNADYERGRDDERAAIVAWLREEQARLEGIANKQSAYMRDEFTDGQAYWSDMAADAIENGEHLRGDDE